MAEERRSERVEHVERDVPAPAPDTSRVERVEHERVTEEPAAPAAPATNVNVSQPAARSRASATTYTSYDDAQRSPYWAAGKINQVLWFICGVLEVLLGLRFLLLLMGANPASGFAAFIYAITGPFIMPFAGLVASPGVNGGPVLEVVSLVAMLVYFLFFLLLTQFVRLLVSRPREQF
jgi:hypothetical protein